MTYGLTVERLSVDRGGRPVLRDLSFHLPHGAAMVVTGSNGAGKSTLLRAVAGLIPLVGGEVRLGLGDRDSSDAGPATPAPVNGTRWPREAGSDEGTLDLQEHTSYLGHGNGLKLSLTAAENLRFAADWTGGAAHAAAAALDAVGLGHVADFPVRILSAGQRRRVALAGLLVTHRPLWLLDEPATALDATAELLLAGLLRAHLAAGGMILAAIHSPLDLPARQLRLGAA